MGKDKLKRFAEVDTFPNVLQHHIYDEPHLTKVTGERLDMRGRWAEHFGNDNPITLELACGKGEYTLALAKRYPNRNFIGIDLKGNRIWRGAKTALEENIPNVAFIRTRIEFIQNFFAPKSVDQIWITFADPQPKKEKKRLTAAKFLNLYRPLLADDGLMHLKTDSDILFDYSVAITEALGEEVLYCNFDIYSKPLDFPELEHKTYYETMHLNKGKTIKYMRFRLDRGEKHWTQKEA